MSKKREKKSYHRKYVIFPWIWFPLLLPPKNSAPSDSKKSILVNVSRVNISKGQRYEQKEADQLSGVEKSRPFFFRDSRYTSTPGGGRGRLTGPNSYISINNDDVCPTLGFPIIYSEVQRRCPIFVPLVEVCSGIYQCLDHSHMPIGSLRHKSPETMKRPPSPYPTQYHVNKQKRPHWERWRISTGGLRAS